MPQNTPPTNEFMKQPDYQLLSSQQGSWTSAPREGKHTPGTHDREITGKGGLMSFFFFLTFILFHRNRAINGAFCWQYRGRPMQVHFPWSRNRETFHFSTANISEGQSSLPFSAEFPTLILHKALLLYSIICLGFCLFLEASRDEVLTTT